MGKIAVPLAEGFEDSEFTVPAERLKKLGHQVVVLGAKSGMKVLGKRRQASAEVDATAERLRAESFEALVIPGGHSPDELRIDPHVVEFVRRFFATGRPVAAICHGPQLLIEADVVRDRTLTSAPSVRKDLENAGAQWIDRPVVEDEQLITSRGPEDLEVFCDALVARL
jgi:protease I